jgi:hypothetical protein
MWLRILLAAVLTAQTEPCGSSSKSASYAGTVRNSSKVGATESVSKSEDALSNLPAS